MTVLIILSVAFISFLSYLQYTSDLKEQFSNKNSQITGLVSLNVDTYLDDLFRLSLSPYYNDAVMDALDKRIYGDDIKYLERLRIVENFLDEMMIIPRNDILRVMIFTDEIYSSERIPMALNSKVNYKSFDWYKKVMQLQKPIFIPAQLDQMVKHPKNKVFSVVNILRSTRNTDRIIGVIKVDATYSGIESICSKINMGKDGGIYIIDGNNQIIYSNVKNLPFVAFYNNVKSSKKYVIQKYKNKSYLTNYTKIPRANWTIVSVSSLDEIYSAAAQTRNNAFVLAIICSVLALIILVILAKWLLEPFLYTIGLMKEVEKGDFKVSFPEIQDDEVGYLDASLNRMLSTINEMMDKNTELVKEVYESKYLQKEAHLKTLYNQIRPHFIYNSLNMISILIQSGRHDKAVDNINKLSSILRCMANCDKNVTLEYELNILEAYLGIQVSRYEGRLEYNIDVNKDLYSSLIPALILQPIVENSVIHGCENRREKTIIKIWSDENSSRIIINIEDNCQGMDEAELEKLKCKLDPNSTLNEEISSQTNGTSTSTGIGLYNVNRRIKIKYGNEYGLTIESIKNKGTIVRITIPKDFKEVSTYV